MSKTEAISQKLQKQPKMSKNGHFWVIKAKKIPVFEFLQEYQYSNTLEDTKGKILGSLQPKLMSKTEVRSQNSVNGLKSANFWAIKAKKIPDSEFLQGFGYSNTLEHTKEKILGSFQPKIMSKTEVISQNSENGLKSANFWAIKAKKYQIPNFYRDSGTQTH